MCKNRRSGCTGKKKQNNVDNQYQPFHTLFIKQWGTRVRQAEIVQWVISALFVYIATLLCVPFTIAVMNQGLVGLKYTQIGSLRKICRQSVWVAELVGGILQAFQLCWCWENGTELESRYPQKKLQGIILCTDARISVRLDMQSTKSRAEARMIQDSREVVHSCSFSSPPRDCRDQREKVDKMSPAGIKILELQYI